MNFEQLEQARLVVRQKQEKIHKTYMTVFVCFIAIYIFGYIFAALKAGTNYRFEFMFHDLMFGIIPLSIIIFVLDIITKFIATGKENKAYHDAYKSYFVSRALQQVFTDITYSHAAGMPNELIADTRMVNMGDRYSSNDYVVAKYKGLNFMQADVHIQEVNTDSDGDTSYVTIFRGRWVIFDSKKKFEKRLLVEGKQFNAAKTAKADNFKKIELESIEFNKNFNVYAQDGFEAFYLLDPAVMERIQKLSDLHGGRIMVCFADNKIHIGINNNIDSFEPASVYGEINQNKEFAKVMNDIKVVTNIVDEIKLVG